MATIKGKTLNIILAKIKETKKGVKKISIAFTRQLQLKPNYKDNNCKTIYSDKLQFKDLPLAKAQFNKIKNLKKLIAKFIALHS